jgi:outer membrane lipoprotein-sorting protein
MSPRSFTQRLWPLACLTLIWAARAAIAADLTVDEIVERHIKARGGLEKIKSIQTLRETGLATSGADRQAVVTRLLKRPHKARFEATRQGVTSVIVSDGEQGWKMSPFEGDTAPIKLDDEVVRESIEQGDIEGPLVDWRKKGHQVELAGRVVVDGHDTYKLKLTLQSGAVRTEYLDAHSFQRVRTESTRLVKGRGIDISTTFADYKRTAGLAFPRTIDIQAAGRPQGLHVEVKKVEVNPPLNDALFEMKAVPETPPVKPAGAKPPAKPQPPKP